MAYITNISIILLSLTTISCSDSASFDGAEQSQRSAELYEDRDSADVPTAVAGGIYLFKCQHQDLDSETTECSLFNNDSNKKVQLDEHFSSTRINVETPEGVRSIVSDNEEDYESHWTVQLINDSSDFSKKDIFKNTKISLLVNDIGNVEETTFSTTSVLSSGGESAEDFMVFQKNAQKKGYKSVEFEGNFYVETKTRESCQDACKDLRLKPNLDIKVNQLHADVNKCKKIFEKLGYKVNRVHYEGDGTKIGKAIGLSYTAKGYGCNRSKWTYNIFDNDYHFSITSEYKRSKDLGGRVAAVKGKSVCSCE